MRWLALAAIVILSGCSRQPSPAGETPPPAPAKAEPNGVTCTDPVAKELAWISDGAVGVRIGRDGLAQGPAFVASSYEVGGEERLQPVQNLVGLSLTMDGEPIVPRVGNKYSQRLDFGTQRLATRFTSDFGEVESTSWAEGGVVRQVWKLRASRPGFFQATILDGATLRIRKDGSEADESFQIGEGTVVEVEVNPLLMGEALPAGATIEIDGPVEDQQAVNSFLSYLRMAVPPATGRGDVLVTPTGLSSEIYKGHVFWDADVWVFPALALLDPERAKTIPEYRIAKLPEAVENGALWQTERYQLLNPGQRMDRKTAIQGAAKYPWEGSTSGRETMIGQFRHALHVNGAVLWGLHQAEWLGMATPEDLSRATEAMARLYRTVVEKRDGKLTIRRVFGVDEFRLTDDDLITNILAEWTLNGRTYPGEDSFYLPEKDGVFLTYRDDAQISFKQAGAVLSIYPYQFPRAEARAKQMMAYHADRTNPKGPAMTEAIHAVIYARLGESERAYAEWRKSWGDFTQGRPLLLFSEHRTRDRTYFVTGAAGCLQTVLYGFLGFRIDYQPEPGAKWSQRLRGGGWLSIKPRLPKEWKRVVIRNFSVLGQRYTATITADSVQVVQGDS